MIDNIFYLSSFHLLSFHPDYAQPPYHCKWLLIARRLLKPALEGCLESNLSRQLSTRASAPLSTKPRYLAKGEFEQFYMKQKWLHEKQYNIFFQTILKMAERLHRFHILPGCTSSQFYLGLRYRQGNQSQYWTFEIAYGFA